LPVISIMRSRTPLLSALLIVIAAGVASPAAAQPAAPTLVGSWERSSPFVPTYADPTQWGTTGYSASRYEFSADGSYRFLERSFRGSMANILLALERGSYAVQGNRMTITPVESAIESYQKRNGVDELGRRVSVTPRARETVTYTMTMHYVGSIQRWNLVLQAPEPTRRDGPFSTNTALPNAWYFEQRAIDDDLAGVRVRR
jgi:hypothetical protein